MTEKCSNIDTEDEAIQVCLGIPDHETFVEFMHELDFGDKGINIISITRSPLNHDVSVTIDLSGITNTQRRTVLRALELGYYQYPRKLNLGELTEEFDVSKSAVSQRVRAVERKLVQEVFSQFLEEPLANPREQERLTHFTTTRLSVWFRAAAGCVRQVDRSSPKNAPGWMNSCGLSTSMRSLYEFITGAKRSDKTNLNKHSSDSAVRTRTCHRSEKRFSRTFPLSS